ncbi:DUF3081 family protein [Ferrimonas pelagia]|uniref:DUF3081 domain-containing protein n=1 Tax=Ferrimonas pelagia TaxID=1177826 RepID=A0ABP9EW73_9GAMM
MKDEIDIRQALRVFDRIRQYGQPCSDGYRWQGVIAASGYDGYQISLSDGTVTLWLMFHSSHQFESGNRLEREQLLQRLAQLDAIDRVGPDTPRYS